LTVTIDAAWVEINGGAQFFPVGTHALCAKVNLTYIPLEYRFTGVSMNASMPENDTMSSNFLCISVRPSPT